MEETTCLKPSDSGSPIRVCMTAATLVLEPIFEADLPPEQYAYRPGRNAQQAAVEVEELLFRGHREVVDADLADFFGSIPHTELMKSVARRIVDRRVLHLIKMWLECAVASIEPCDHNAPGVSSSSSASSSCRPSRVPWYLRMICSKNAGARLPRFS